MCEVLTITPSRKSHVVNAVVMLGSVCVCVCVSVCARAAIKKERDYHNGYAGGISTH